MASPIKTAIIICGPTAVGKTALAIELAKYYDTRIISADSKQCYKELSIGVAKPSRNELDEVYHYFINSHSIFDDVNAALFEEYALSAAEEIFTGHHVAVMVGGTGLYIKAFCEGLDEMPHIPAGIKQDIVLNYKNGGLTWLQNEVKEQDASFWEHAEQSNPHRLMRALEVRYATGRSVMHYRGGAKKTRQFNILKIGLELSKEQLHSNINRRVDQMIADNLVGEARLLFPQRHLNALQTVGYRELFDHFSDNTTLDQAVANIKTNTRRYAKRQMTWFKKDPTIRWHRIENQVGSALIENINSHLKI